LDQAGGFCAQCLASVAEDAGFETPKGHVLCGSCYFALWRPKGAHELKPEVEEKRPKSRRERIKSIWSPGPLGELDP